MAETRYLDGMPAIKNSGILTETRDAQTVWMWDCGPEEPIIPEEPEPPALLPSDPKHALAMMRHRRAVKKYEDDLAIYDRNEREFQNWHRNIRGPVEMAMWSTEARDALEHDGRAVTENRQKKRRYYVSSRTRGWEKTKNYGLPIGIEPGAGHQENLERQLAGEKEFIDALRKDPQFGRP
jgi:hypothetical protein